MATLGLVTPQMPACNRPMRRHPVGGRGFGRVTVKPLGFPSHRPHSHGTRQPPGSGGICRGLPLNVVRIAPLHDAGITAQP